MSRMKTLHHQSSLTYHEKVENYNPVIKIYIYYIYIYSITMSHIASKTLIFWGDLFVIRIAHAGQPHLRSSSHQGSTPTWTEKRDTGKYDEIWLANIIYSILENTCFYLFRAPCNVHSATLNLPAAMPEACCSISPVSPLGMRSVGSH